MHTAPHENHRWLMQFVGDWTSEMEAQMGPGQPVMKHKGSETVRSMGGLWVIGDGVGEMPGGDEALMILTLGYDPQRGRFVGSWVGSMMTWLWVYDGELDAGRRVLTLNCQGPDMAGGDPAGCGEGPSAETAAVAAAPLKLANYRDVHEIVSPDHRILTSHYQGQDGTWTQFMKAEYRRVG